MSLDFLKKNNKKSDFMKFEVYYGYVHYYSGKCVIEARNEQEAREKFDNGDYTIIEDGDICDVGEFKIEEIYELEEDE